MKKKYVISKKNSQSSKPTQGQLSTKQVMLDKSPSPKLLQTPKSQEPIPFSQIAGEIKAENPPKKGPGRPKKNLDNVISAGTTSSNQESHAQTAVLTANAPSNVPPELIGMTLVQASALAAGIWHNPGYVIEEAQSLEDGKSLKPAVDALLDKWLPHVGPWALELTFAGAIAAIVFRQYKNGQKLSNDQPG